ncbi:hypothetical protein GGF32_003656 [Allomyces javanicus]|nr:hypothetical protein GGF32_003656 [Allomyces javanicus]
MGKRKSSRKPVAKVKPKLATVFNCLYCNHEKSVEVKMERDKKIGTIKCRVCQELWQTTISALSEPIDVYSDWIDACEAAQREADTHAAQYGAYDDDDAYGAHHDDYAHADSYDDRPRAAAAASRAPRPVIPAGGRALDDAADNFLEEDLY